ncbi:hypothetical protein CBS76997_10738 [Aspergillus niger]|nr:hypothetical protein CBS13152_10770 [Aspergillus niger]KAI2952662.1 hypothetical protein CBS147323_10274 [Aspergillus niger]KAI3035108.1 hypothetical protein CBS76997_10738 [Aspergillus niger]
MTDTAKFEQFGLSAFYNNIPILDNASDWFKWNQKVNQFIRISPVADDGAVPPIEEDEARQWTHRQKFYSAMITAKLTHNAAQRINAFEISQVQLLIQAVKDHFKPEGTGTYVNLQRRYMSLTREKCGSAQALGAEIRKIHAEKLLLDPDCVTSEIERTFFFMHALGPEYESFRDHIFRQMDLVNERDANGTITKAAPTFDYIENKAIEEEHRKGQLGKQTIDRQTLPALALIRGPGDKKLIPSLDGTTCRIEIDNVPYCSFCRKPYHVDSECFRKNPKRKDQAKEGRSHKERPSSSHTGARKPLKRRPSTDDEDDDVVGPKDPKKPTFMATKVSGEDVNKAFGKGVEGNFVLFDHIPSLMATQTLTVRDAWIVHSGCAQHVCNSTSRFIQMDKYHGPPLRSVDASTTPSGVGTVNILCNARGRRKWLVLDNVLYVPSAHANLISVLQLLNRGAKIEFSSQGASIRNKSNGKNLYTASQYHGVYALDLWTNLTFPAYHVSPQMTLWHNRLAHLSDANLQRLKKQAHGIRDMEPRQPCNPCLQGRMIEKPIPAQDKAEKGNLQWNSSILTLQGHLMRDWTAVATGSLLLTTSQQNGVAERAHKTIYDRIDPTLAHAGLPPKFWSEIARTAAFLSNRSPSSKLNMTPYQAWYGDKPDLSRLRVIGSKGEYLIPPKLRKKLTGPRTRPCILLGYEGNTNYRILLEDGRIVGTPNAEFHEVLEAPSTQTREDVVARRDGLPAVTAAAAGGSETLGLINQPSSSNKDSQTPASSQSSDEDSQPPVAVQGDRTLSPTRSDDTFGPFADDLQDIVQRNESPTGGDQQQGDAHQGQDLGKGQRYPEIQRDHPIHTVPQEALENHPELKVRAPQVILDTFSDSEEELALMNIPKEHIIPTFLTVAAKETEPFEPSPLHQAKNDASWLEWEGAMLEKVNSLHQNKTWELVDPPTDRGFSAENGSSKSNEDRMAKSSATNADGYLQLTYKGQSQMLKGFTDADWGGCRNTRRSTAGYLFNIGSGAISWQSKRQSVVALSTCEAEFLGQTQATKEAICLRRLLNELNMSQGKAASIICGDNQGAIALSSNPQCHSRTKHMGIQRKWQGEFQGLGTVELKYIPTTEQIADGFTKPLPRERCEWFRKGLGIE